MAAIAPSHGFQPGNPDLGRPGQQLLPGYVVKLLKTLKIPFGTDRTMSGVDVDPTVNLISHIIDCLGALRDVNKVYRAKGSLAARSVGTRVLYGYTSELGNILLDAITFDPPNDLVDSCVYYSQIAGSILNVFPEIAAQVTPATGKVLLHHTALKTSSIMAAESIKMVLKAFPAGAWTADRTGALPLHWITHNSNCNQAMISTLIAANPKGPWVADADGYLPLHWAVNQDEPNVDVVAALIAANPGAASKACNRGSLPIHWCVNRDRVHMGVLRSLVQIHPDGVRTFDKTGWLPLHQCVNRCDITIEAMQQLIDLYPQGLQCPNSNGQLPLHRALDQPEPNLDAVAILLRAFPGAAKVADDEGYLPLHLALDCARPNVNVASLLLEHYPEAAFHKSKDGLLPMHCIISSMYPVIEIIQQLLSIFPDSCESMAVDVIPADEGADPESWQGDWVEKRWTPLSRAIDRGLDAVVVLFRDALNGGRLDQRGANRGAAVAPIGGNTAVSRVLQPQAQPPLHNLSHLLEDGDGVQGQHAAMSGGADPGPSTSSVEGHPRHPTNNRLMLGGTLDLDDDGAVPRPSTQHATSPPGVMHRAITKEVMVQNGAESMAMSRPLTRPQSQGSAMMPSGTPPPIKDRVPGGLRGQTPGGGMSVSSLTELKQRERDRRYSRDEDRDRRRSSSKQRGRDRDRERDRDRDRDGRHRSRGRGDRDRERDRDPYYDDESLDDYDRPPRSSSRRRRDRDRSSSRHRDRDRDRERERERDHEREREPRKFLAERIYEDQEFDHEESIPQRSASRPLSASATGNRPSPSEPPPRSLREAAVNNVRAQSAGATKRDEAFSRNGGMAREAQDAAIELDHVV